MSLFTEFFSFLKNNNIFPTFVATIFSTYISELVISFTDNLIMPILNRDGDKDGKPDIKKIEDYKLNIFKINFQIGKLIIIGIKVFIIFLIVFFMSRLYNKADSEIKPTYTFTNF